jgi:manganese/iron transport system permease protein
MSLIEAWLMTPLSFDFMRRGLVMAVLVGTVCAVLSCYLVLKGWALLGDAISHAVLPGVVVASALGLPLAVGAFAAGLFCAFATGHLKETSRLKEDTVMAIVFSGLFALGLVLITLLPGRDLHVSHILFGNMLGVTWADVWESGLVVGLVLAIVLLKRRDLMLFCFDPAHARAIGLDVRLLHYGLLVLVALAIVAALKAVGVILVIAMLIAPGAIGFILARRFETMLPIAVGVAVVSSVLGTVASFPLDVAPGPLIVVLQALAFALALGWKRVAERATRVGA